jgi:ribosomal protein S18 acetylase RimI-like enzyme
MTQGTFDLYWIATDPSVRGTGVGRKLVEAMEEELKGRGAARIRVETSASEGYEETRTFYERTRYLEEARIRDFYRAGDDLIILVKRLGS